VACRQSPHSFSLAANLVCNLCKVLTELCCHSVLPPQQHCREFIWIMQCTPQNAAPDDVYRLNRSSILMHACMHMQKWPNVLEALVHPARIPHWAEASNGLTTRLSMHVELEEACRTIRLASEWQPSSSLTCPSTFPTAKGSQQEKQAEKLVWRSTCIWMGSMSSMTSSGSASARTYTSVPLIPKRARPDESLSSTAFPRGMHLLKSRSNIF
jgi:hypothetical protein